MAKRIREFKYVEYETYMKAYGKFIESKKAENELLKKNGYQFYSLTGKEMNLLKDRGLNLYINDGWLVVKDGKMFNRSEALHAIKENRQAEGYNKTLGQLYGEWFGIEGTDKQKAFAGRIRLEVLWVLDEMKGMVPRYALYHKDIERVKMEKAIDVLKAKVEAMKDAKQIISNFKAVLDTEKLKDQAYAVLKGMNFTGEKGKAFVEAMTKVIEFNCKK